MRKQQHCSDARALRVEAPQLLEHRRVHRHDERRKLAVSYCGSAGERSERVVYPHQVMQHENRWYVYVWCENVTAFRMFRADRFLAAHLTDAPFELRPDFRPVERAEQLLEAHDPLIARVVFSVSIARWLRERYPAGREVTKAAPQPHRDDIVSCLEASEHTMEAVMRWEDRIAIDPKVLAGKPVIKGTRLAVEFIVDLFAQGWTEAQILENYPGVAREDIRACLQYASEILKSERVFPVAARS